MLSLSSASHQRDIVQGIIFRALQNLNQELGPESQIAICDYTLLLGEESQIDSLSLVSVIVDVETVLADELDLVVSLTDDRAMRHEPSPYTDVQALIAYTLLLLSERS